jgi:anti-sigma B factor antagonist
LEVPGPGHALTRSPGRTGCFQDNEPFARGQECGRDREGARECIVSRVCPPHRSLPDSLRVLGNTSPMTRRDVPAGKANSRCPSPATPAWSWRPRPGEIDLATAHTFAQHLESTLAGPPAAVIADLGQVAFLSSSGLAALQIFAHAANSAGVAFCLVSAQRTMLRHLRLTALDRDMTIKPTVAEARACLSGKPTSGT